MSEILPAITAHALALAVEPCEGSLQAAGRCNKAGTTRVSEVVRKRKPSGSTTSGISHLIVFLDHFQDVPGFPQIDHGNNVFICPVCILAAQDLARL